MGAKEQISLMQLSNGDRPIVQCLGEHKKVCTVIESAGEGKLAQNKQLKWDIVCNWFPH